jgi:hypothetical protein
MFRAFRDTRPARTERRTAGILRSLNCRCVLAIIATEMLALPGAPLRRLAAQNTAVISGVVQDRAGKPIPAVEVHAVKPDRLARTDSAGRFTLTALPAGNVDLTFRRLAYTPATVSMDAFADDTIDIEVTLTVVAQKLEAVVVQAPSEMQRRLLAGFEERRKHLGTGHFITRAQIEDRHASLLGDVMTTTPGMTFVLDRSGRRQLRFSRVGRSDCPPTYIVDGIPASFFNIDDIPPGDVEGIELYSGPAGLPPQFGRIGRTSVCGTVVIWTRIPGT